MSGILSQRWALPLLVKPHLQGWRSRGRGSNGGGTSETLGCWERQGEGGGRGPRVGRAGQREESTLPLCGAGGLLGPFFAPPQPQPPPRCASSSS